MAYGSAMKRLLLGNDNWGNQTMRGIILDEYNKTTRYVDRLLEKYATQQPAATPVETEADHH
jgi:hypothetical protein